MACRPKPTPSERERLRRKHSLILRLNDYELEALRDYCATRGGASRSKLMREILMMEVVRSLARETPRLFSEDDLR